MLDDKSKVLYEHLLAYARFPVKKLSHIINSSEATIVNRIKNLEKDGYISRYDAIINWQKLSFIKKVYFIKVSKNTKKFESEMINQHPVFSIIELNGLYNYQVWCFFNTKKQISEFERIIKKLGYHQIEINELVFPRVTFFAINLKLQLPKIKDNNIKINKIDIAIMKYMAQGHGRDSFYSISKAIKLPYDSVHYHGMKILNSGYFIAIIAQPGTNKLTLQTTSLLIECINDSSSDKLFELLKKLPKVQSDAIGKENKILVHFLSQTHIEYRESLSKILDLIPKDEIKDVLITHWSNVIMNNRYPLEYLLKSK